MSVIIGLIESFFREYQHKVTVRQLQIKTKNDKERLVIETMRELTASEAVTYLTALSNAINHHKYNKTKEWKVKELDIELLD